MIKLTLRLDKYVPFNSPVVLRVGLSHLKIKQYKING